MTWTFCNMWQISFENIEDFSKPRNQHARNQKPRNQEAKTLFHFQVRESPAPLNMPTPTLAPDRGGPVAWQIFWLEHMKIHYSFFRHMNCLLHYHVRSLLCHVRLFPSARVLCLWSKRLLVVAFQKCFKHDVRERLPERIKWAPRRYWTTPRLLEVRIGA